ncbi:MAG: 50S ribosomal protein L31e [Candidatus Hydrothermarchaeaceae archaeon]
MADVYVINVRDALRAPRRKRAAKAIAYVRSFMEKRVKRGEVRIDPSLNEKLWGMGMEHVPHKLKVKVVEQEDGSVLVTPA